MTKVSTEAATISSNIKRLREAVNWTQTKLADEAGISGAALSKIEQGDGRMPTIVVLQKLASALKVDVSEITGMVPPNRTETEERLSEFYRTWGLLDELEEPDKKLLREMAERVRKLQSNKEPKDK